MLIKVSTVLFVYLICVNAEYRGGFGPRPPDSFVPTRNENYADLLTKNNQQQISAPLIPVAAPTIYRPSDPNQPTYLFGPTIAPQFIFQPTRPTQQLSNDLSRVPRPSQSNPFSQRDKIFGIKPLPDPRLPQPFNPSPNIYGQSNVDRFPQPDPFSIPNTHRVIETVSDLHVYPARIEHGFIGGQVQQSQQNQGRPQIDIPLVPSKHVQEIGRFDTNVDRFASDSEIQQQQRQRFVLPMDLANAPMESFLRRPEPNQQSRPVVSVGTQPVNANTRILESDHKIETLTATIGTPLRQGHTLPLEMVTPFTTYPDYRADVFPELINHAHDEKRPATGRRVGPQGRFGGGTNEYLEDLGIRTFGINDQRRPWEHLPGRFSNEPTNRPPNAGYKDVALENLYSSNNNQQRNNTRMDQDLTKTQPFSSISFGKYDKDWSELITPAPRSVITSTVIGVPLYPEFGTGYHGKSGDGPANKYIGGAISSPNVGTRIELETVNGELDDGLRPYQGPEDITNSRYQPIPSNEKRNFKLDLLNE